jgi:hypothetical protein
MKLSIKPNRLLFDKSTLRSLEWEKINGNIMQGIVIQIFCVAFYLSVFVLSQNTEVTFVKLSL